jgi:hypothetical protein
MQRFVRTLALLAGLLLLAGLVAACNGDGEGEPSRAEGTFITGHVEGDFVAPDSHAFTRTFALAGLSGTQEAVIIGDGAWIREEGGDWRQTARSDPDLPDAIRFTSADPDFLRDEDFAEDLAALDSEPERINGVDTRRYLIPKEAVGTLAHLLGQDFLGDASDLQEFEMTVWLEEETGALVRAELTVATATAVFAEDAGAEVSSGATTSISMVVDITQINDPAIAIEPPITDAAETGATAARGAALPFDSFHYTVDLEVTIRPGEE